MATCLFCGSSKNLQKHHLIPLRQGGEDSFYNRVWLCKQCHQDIHEHGVGLPKTCIIKRAIQEAVPKLTKRVIQENGRIFVPSKIRKALGIYGLTAFCEVETHGKNEILFTVLARATPNKRGLKKDVVKNAKIALGLKNAKTKFMSDG